MINADIRCEMKKKRSSLSSEEVEAASELIFEKIKALDLIFEKQNFLVYKDFKNEIKTDKIISYLRHHEKTVAHPITIGENMIAAVPTGEDVAHDVFGIEIPMDYSIMEAPEVIFVPLVACDENKNRLGFGKGFYDRYMSGRHTLKIGLCYDFQVVDTLSANEWDVPLDIIITEKRIIW